MNIDTQTYRDSLTTLLRRKKQRQQREGGAGGSDAAAAAGGDPKYVAGAQRVLDFMHDNWQRQKLCDVVISAQNGDLQAGLKKTFFFKSPTQCVLGFYWVFWTSRKNW